MEHRLNVTKEEWEAIEREGMACHRGPVPDGLDEQRWARFLSERFGTEPGVIYTVVLRPEAEAIPCEGIPRIEARS